MFDALRTARLLESPYCATVRLLWVCGHPCSGKTWIGDYLESRGYKHIDGDYHLQNQKKSEESKRIADGLLVCFNAMQKGEKVTEEMFKVFYDDCV